MYKKGETVKQDKIIVYPLNQAKIIYFLLRVIGSILSHPLGCFTDDEIPSGGRS